MDIWIIGKRTGRQHNNNANRKTRPSRQDCGISRQKRWNRQGKYFTNLYYMVLIFLEPWSHIFCPCNPQTLKIIRYASKLLLATSLEGSTQLSSLESSIGTSRKAYRLGKFLQNINAARKIPLRHHPHATLELVANAGECIYYFVDQFQW